MYADVERHGVFFPCQSAPTVYKRRPKTIVQLSIRLNYTRVTCGRTSQSPLFCFYFPCRWRRNVNHVLQRENMQQSVRLAPGRPGNSRLAAAGGFSQQPRRQKRPERVGLQTLRRAACAVETDVQWQRDPEAVRPTEQQRSRVLQGRTFIRWYAV